MSSRLMSLPTELRLILYELVFTPDFSENEEIDIQKTCRRRGPHCNLLATCHEIQREAQELFDDVMDLLNCTLQRYCVEITSEIVTEWDCLDSLVALAGPYDIPPAKSLRVIFDGDDTVFSI